MNFQWVTVANHAVINRGVLDLNGAGWTTYDPGGFPGLINATVAGTLTLAEDEIDVPFSLILSVTGDGGSTMLAHDRTQLIVQQALTPAAGPINVPFAIPLSVPVPRPTSVQIDLECELPSRGTGAAIAARAHIAFGVTAASCGALPSAQTEMTYPGRSRTWAARCIEKALHAWEAGDYEGAALFAFVAFDSTASRAYPNLAGNGNRFKKLLRENALVFERFGAPGLDVESSRFPAIQGIKGNKDGSSLDVADIVYHAYRCGYVHGDNSPPSFILSPDNSAFGFEYPKDDQEAVLHLPTITVIGLLAVCLLEPTSRDIFVRDEDLALWWQPPNPDASQRLLLPLNEWFGRRDDFMAYQQQHARSAVTVTPGDNWQVSIDPDGGETIRITTFSGDLGLEPVSER